MFRISPKLDEIFSSIRQRLEAAVGGSREGLTPRKSDKLPTPSGAVLCWAVPVIQIDGCSAGFTDGPTILLGTYPPEKFDPSLFEEVPLPGSPTRPPSSGPTYIGECELLNEFLARRTAG